MSFRLKKLSIISMLVFLIIGTFSAAALADISHPNNAGSSSGTNSTGATGEVYLPPYTGAVGQTQGIPGYNLIHSDYPANTDACAACHAPHTANGADLTQWDTFSNSSGLTDVCLACHDGTVTKTYDVLNGTIGTTGLPSSAGLFAVEYDGTSASTLSASQHNVFSNLTIGGAAYGGATTATSDSNGSWTGTFDCTACHDPHGQGGNSRLLSPDPNDVEQSTTQTLAYNASFDGGKSGYVFPAGQRPILGFPYGVSYTVDGTTGQSLATLFTTDTTIPTIYVNQPSGHVILATYTPVLQVNFTITGKLTSAETVTYNYGINTFCGACHTDYNTETYNATHAKVNGAPASTAELNGVYGTQHTRHDVGYKFGSYASVPQLTFETMKDDGSATQAGTVTCLTCHYAHGVDQTRWPKRRHLLESLFITHPKHPVVRV